MKMKPVNRNFIAMAAFIMAVVQSQTVLADAVLFKPEKMRYRATLTDNCTPKKIQAINKGQTAIQNPEFSLQGSDAFRIQKYFRKCPNPVGPGEKCQVYVDFCPPLAKNYEAVLKFSGSDQTVPLKGSGYSASF